MRLMHRIRTRFRVFFISFALIFIVSVFAGLGLGFSGAFSGRSSTQNSAVKVRTLVPGESSVAMIDGAKIGYDRFNRQLKVQEDNMRGQGRTKSNDPFAQWKDWSDVLDSLFTEEVLAKYASEANLSVSDADVAKEINKRVDTMFPPEMDKGASKSVVGAAGKWLRTATEREKYMRQYLDTLGETQASLRKEVRQQLTIQKAYDAIETEEKSKADAKAQEKIKKIQAALKGGEDFGSVAKQYSDDTGTKDKGGVIDQFVSRGFFDAAFDEAVFKMKVGEVSDPIKVEFGYQIVKLLGKKEAKGPDFEKAKPTLTETIKKKKGAEYKVTDEDLKNEFEQVNIQHITLRTLVDRETAGRIYWLTFAAKKEIYDPMILAWRAANSEPMYMPAIEKTTPEMIAQDSLVTKGTDLSKLGAQMNEFVRVQLMRYQYSYGDPPDNLKPLFAEYKLEYGKTQDPMKPPVYPTLTKLYPLAAGLIKQAIKLQDGMAGYHYALASIDDTWASDTETRKIYPLDLDAAHAEIEAETTKAIKLYEHNGYYYALAGKNYAEWVKPEQAREMLAKAEKYAPGDVDLLQILTSAYRVNGDTEKGNQYQDMLLQEQQKLWQQQQANYMNFQQ
jgi:parvulin-like peptidyl-prolyl isomerase